MLQMQAVMVGSPFELPPSQDRLSAEVHTGAVMHTPATPCTTGAAELPT